MMRYQEESHEDTPYIQVNKAVFHGMADELQDIPQSACFSPVQQDETG